MVSVAADLEEAEEQDWEDAEAREVERQRVLWAAGECGGLAARMTGLSGAEWAAVVSGRRKLGPGEWEALDRLYRIHLDDAGMFGVTPGQIDYRGLGVFKPIEDDDGERQFAAVIASVPVVVRSESVEVFSRCGVIAPRGDLRAGCRRG